MNCARRALSLSHVSTISACSAIWRLPGFDTVKKSSTSLHKRSRLIMSERHRFFSEVGL